MSDAIKIASQAPKLVEGMLADMFAAQAKDNRVCMGSVQSGPQHIQIQLVVTSRPDALLDDDSTDDDEADSTEQGQPKNGLWLHWQNYRAEYLAAGLPPRNFDYEIGAFLALGAIRAIYWVALGQNDVALAVEIREWWEEHTPQHGFGEGIL